MHNANGPVPSGTGPFLSLWSKRAGDQYANWPGIDGIGGPSQPQPSVGENGLQGWKRKLCRPCPFPLRHGLLVTTGSGITGPEIKRRKRCVRGVAHGDPELVRRLIQLPLHEQLEPAQ